MTGFGYNTPMLKTLPAEYLCCDPGSFAANTLAVRLPEIARRMLAENHFPEPIVAAVGKLLDEMRTGPIQALEDPGAPDQPAWAEYMRPHLGKPWAGLSFFVCENYFYRRLLAATGYFQPGYERGLDPYAEQKRLGLETSRTPLAQLARRLAGWRRHANVDTLVEAIETNLWGNRADLSLWPAGAEGTLSNDSLHQAEEYLLVNENPRLAAFITGLKGGRIDLLIDNAGFELGCDLALADLLLSSGLAREVRFHLKFHPTFVSDALVEDVRRTALFFAEIEDQEAGELSRRLVGWMENGWLLLRPNAYWNSPLPGWEMPGDLRAELGGADLAISKGDANFRRLLGDLRWPAETRFNDICAYYPTRLAALRVDKSELAVNLRPGQAGEMDLREPDWRSNGKWGMIQLTESIF
jgi:hypothetical protein